jgi:hypothetical protein
MGREWFNSLLQQGGGAEKGVVTTSGTGIGEEAT